MFEARDGAEPSVWGSRERAPRAPARQSDAGGPSFPPGMRRTAGMRSAPAPAGRCAHLPLAVGLHQLAERRVPLDLELHDGAILPSHLQVDVVVLCLHSFLGKTGRAEISARRGPTLPPCSACDPPRARRAPAAPRRAYLGLLLRHGGRTGPGGPVGAGRARPARCLPPGSRSRRQPPARERAQPRPRRPAPATPRPDWPPGRSRERRVGGMSDRAQLGASRKCVTERRKRRERGAGLRGREGGAKHRGAGPVLWRPLAGVPQISPRAQEPCPGLQGPRFLRAPRVPSAPLGCVTKTASVDATAYTQRSSVLQIHSSPV